MWGSRRWCFCRVDHWHNRSSTCCKVVAAIVHIGCREAYITQAGNFEFQPVIFVQGDIVSSLVIDFVRGQTIVSELLIQ